MSYQNSRWHSIKSIQYQHCFLYFNLLFKVEEAIFVHSFVLLLLLSLSGLAWIHSLSSREILFFSRTFFFVHYSIECAVFCCFFSSFNVWLLHVFTSTLKESKKANILSILFQYFYFFFNYPAYQCRLIFSIEWLHTHMCRFDKLWELHTQQNSQSKKAQIWNDKSHTHTHAYT